MKNRTPRTPVAPKKPLRLVLYSGGQSRANQKLHQEVIRLARAARKARRPRSKAPLQMTYIPYMSDGAHRFFQRAVRRFRAFGIERFFLLEPDHTPSPSEIRVLLESDVIYLAGGNTYTFLAALKNSGLVKPLQQFALSGGVLAGLSAGAILMTPTIQLAGIPQFDADENETPLKSLQDLKALHLVDFEFSPHDTSSPSRKKELTHYSRTLTHPLFAVRDGGGLVVEDNLISGFGNIRVFHRGVCWPLSAHKKKKSK